MRGRTACAAALALLAGALTACDPSGGPGVGAHARVVRVVDGDTLRVRQGGRELTVRLLGIDAPEASDTRYGRPDCGGRRAAALLARLAAPGDRVRLVRDPTQDAEDRYGRLLRYVEKGGRDLGRRVVEAGWAGIYVSRAPFRRLGPYRRAAGSARTAGRGVWAACGGAFHAGA